MHDQISSSLKLNLGSSARPGEPLSYAHQGHPRAGRPEPRKSLSQSFLRDSSVAQAIVAAAELDPGRDSVLEVGPGLGILTERLVQRAHSVVAVEIDTNLASALTRRLPAEQVTIVPADILAVDPSSWFEEPFVVVANLPYHITSPVLRHLLGAGPPHARRLVVMVQREVAERLAAPAGRLSALGVSVQSQARVRVVRQVSAEAFRPRPRVHSTVLRLDVLPEGERTVPRSDQPDFERFVRAGFTQPRKVLANSLAAGLEIPRDAAAACLGKAAIDAQCRPATLTLSEWLRLRASARGLGLW